MLTRNKLIIFLLAATCLVSCKGKETIENKPINNPAIIMIENLGLSNEATINYNQLYKQVISSTVTIINYEKSLSGVLEEAGLGSGSIIKEDDNYYYFLTNRHVVEGADALEVLSFQKQTAAATLLGYDIKQDVAVLRTRKSNLNDVKTVTVHKDNNDEMVLPKVGETVFAIGTPYSLDLQGTMTVGMISGIERIVLEEEDEYLEQQTQAIQLDIAINPGNSGGGLFNLDGELVGVNSLKIASDGASKQESINFALPIHDMYIAAERIIASYKANPVADVMGVFKRYNLGNNIYKSMIDISLANRKDLNVPETLNTGVMVTKVDNLKGIKCNTNSIITKLGGKKIENQVQLRWYLYEYSNSTTIKVGYYKYDETNNSYLYVEEDVVLVQYSEE